MTIHASLMEIEKKKDIRSIISILSSGQETNKEIINKIFYLWYALLEPFFEKSIDFQLRKEFTGMLKNDFKFYTKKFEYDSYFNAVIGYIVVLSSYYELNFGVMTLTIRHPTK
jgi:hypothetical protein